MALDLKLSLKLLRLQSWIPLQLGQLFSKGQQVGQRKPAACVSPPATTQPSTHSQKSLAHKSTLARRLYSGAYHRERERLKSEGLGDKEVLEGAGAAGKQARYVADKRHVFQ